MEEKAPHLIMNHEAAGGQATAAAPVQTEVGAEPGARAAAAAYLTAESAHPATPAPQSPVSHPPRHFSLSLSLPAYAAFLLTFAPSQPSLSLVQLGAWSMVPACPIAVHGAGTAVAAWPALLLKGQDETMLHAPKCSRDRSCLCKAKVREMGLRVKQGGET